MLNHGLLAADGAPKSALEACMSDTETREYRRLDLKWKRIQVGLSAGGFILVLAGLYMTHSQLRSNAANVHHNVRASVWNFALNLDRTLVENPRLFPYIFQGKELKEDDPLYDNVSAAAIMVLDVFEASLDQRDVLTGDQIEEWDRWMIDLFSSSQVLRNTLRDRIEWYSDDLKEMADEAAKLTQTKVSPFESSTP
jgi:hypothetical protein